jgi:3-dehydroquinate synthase
MKAFRSPSGDIFLGKISDGLQEIISSFHASSVFLIADDQTASHCLPLLEGVANTENSIVIPSGEASKSLENAQYIWSSLINSGADRGTMILNIGGGMICDLGGFAAACYQRGIRFGHMPTSLLAMADAAIGGKSGINFQGFKNYIGSFAIPSFIWIDPVFLNTLPANELRNGMTEVVKHAIIGGGELWETISDASHLHDFDWPGVLALNTPVKQEIVDLDPHESGIRKVLNFGHTIGHALESHFLETGNPIAHGRAVTLGMLAEARMSYTMGLLGNEDFQAIILLIKRLLGPYEVTLPPAGKLAHWLSGDKKKSGGRVGYSLPERIGLCRWDMAVDQAIVEESLVWLSTQVRS